MKKYLKSKFEEEGGLGTFETQNDQTERDRKENPPATVVAKNESVQATNEKPFTEIKQEIPTTSATEPQKLNIQPPLPPYPPPDDPVSEIKQEIMEDDHEYMQAQNDQMMVGYQVDAENIKPKPITCKNFVRGKFTHDMFLDQLPGVYVFCIDFRNRQCRYERCKYVHADVLEEERFYRTGYLPPHTIAHWKPTLAPPPHPPPLPPPPPPPPEGMYFL